MNVWIAFGIGLIIGNFMGVFVLSLFIISKNHASKGEIDESNS